MAMYAAVVWTYRRGNHSLAPFNPDSAAPCRHQPTEIPVTLPCLPADDVVHCVLQYGEPPGPEVVTVLLLANVRHFRSLDIVSPCLQTVSLLSTSTWASTFPFLLLTILER